MGDYGIQLSNEGDNVLEQVAETAKFSTKYSRLKVYMEGNTSFTTDGSGNGSVEVSHGLNYAPAWYVYNKDDYQDTFFEATTYTDCFFPIGIWSLFDVYTTDSVLHIGCSGLDATTTYYFRYYILVDLAGDFSGSSGITTSSDYGFKVSKPGYDVLTAEEYQLADSSKYKALQYFQESSKSETLTLPGYSSSVVDQNVTAGTYVDFEHGLGYPPFFLVFYHSDRMSDENRYQEIPFTQLSGSDIPMSEIYGWCDDTRIRVIVNNYAYYPLSNTAYEETYTIKIYVFTEDLNG